MTRIEMLASAVRRFGADRSGATAIEYAVIATGVGVAVVGAVLAVGGTLEGTYYDRLINLL